MMSKRLGPLKVEKLKAATITHVQNSTTCMTQQVHVHVQDTTSAMYTKKTYRNGGVVDSFPDL